jgi:hypothetical protein
MKIFKVIFVLSTLLFSEMLIQAQSADDIISTYIKAIGGKKKLSKISSLYTESSADIMGMEAVIKTTVLNGKGYKTDVEVMGAVITTCFTDQGGWTINPMTGSSSAETMAEEIYNEGKNQIFIGGPFTIYQEQGYTAELLGNEDVKGEAASKVKLTAPWGTSAIYFFDAATGYLVKSVSESEAQGQVVENVVLYSDYKPVGAMLMPHMLDIDSGGMVQFTATITKAEANMTVDPSVFAKP